METKLSGVNSGAIRDFKREMYEINEKFNEERRKEDIRGLGETRESVRRALTNNK
ncbi:hypothetical protein N9J72_00100 [Candidatus Gracilibacteria bacterium]|nr:hypothetical protein [Candidatus Gracilibacteria bacterium]